MFSLFLCFWSPLGVSRRARSSSGRPEGRRTALRPAKPPGPVAPGPRLGAKASRKGRKGKGAALRVMDGGRAGVT